MEQWVSIVNTLVDPVCVRQYLLGYVFPGTRDGSPNRPVIEAALPRMEPLLALLDRAVVATGHLAGEGFTLADANLFPILYYLSKFPESGAMLAKTAHLASYLDRHLTRPSIARTLPQPMPKRG